MNEQSCCGRDPSAAVIAGTTEGRESVGLLAGMGLHLTIFVATKLGKDVLAEVPGIAQMDVQVGRKSKEEFFELFGQQKPLFVVDASHPYAVHVTEAVAVACEKWKIPYIRFLREPAQADQEAVHLLYAQDAAQADQEAVHLLYAQDAAQAAGLLQTMEGPVLLTTGSNTVHIYAERMPDFSERCYVRVLDTPGSLEACRKAGLPMSHVIKGMPPFTMQENLDLIRSLHIRILVTKDSGRTGGLYEKLESARLAHIPVVIIRRPAEAIQAMHANRKGQADGKEQQGLSGSAVGVEAEPMGTAVGVETGPMGTAVGAEAGPPGTAVGVEAEPVGTAVGAEAGLSGTAVGAEIGPVKPAVDAAAQTAVRTAGPAAEAGMESAAIVYAVKSLEELKNLTGVLLANPKNQAGR